MKTLSLTDDQFENLSLIVGAFIENESVVADDPGYPNQELFEDAKKLLLVFVEANESSNG